MNRLSLALKLEEFISFPAHDENTGKVLVVIRILHGALVTMNSKTIEEIKQAAEEIAGRYHQTLPKPEIDQTSEPFENFTREERNIRGLVTAEKGAQAPVLTSMGVGMATILGIRRKNGKVEFGISSDGKQIVEWIKAQQFHHELPD